MSDCSASIQMTDLNRGILERIGLTPEQIVEVEKVITEYADEARKRGIQQGIQHERDNRREVFRVNHGIGSVGSDGDRSLQIIM